MGSGAIVYVVDDDASVRRSLRRLIESIGLTVQDFPGGPEFLGEISPNDPGCLVLDLRMPRMSGLELQQALADRHIELPIIFMSAHGDIGTSVRAMKAGAVDFLEKPFSEQHLLDTIQKAIQHDSQARAARMRRDDALGHVARLSSREREVLALVVAGKMNKEIALALGITEVTVKVHRGHVMEKMGVDSLAELVVLAQLAGVVQPKYDTGAMNR